MNSTNNDFRYVSIFRDFSSVQIANRKTTAKLGGFGEERSKKGRGGRKVERKMPTTGTNGKYNKISRTVK